MYTQFPVGLHLTVYGITKWEPVVFYHGGSRLWIAVWLIDNPQSSGNSHLCLQVFKDILIELLKPWNELNNIGLGELNYLADSGQVLCDHPWHNVWSIYRVTFVYYTCDLEHYLASLAGKILHLSYGKVDILWQNVCINLRVMKVKAGQVLPLSSYQKLIRIIRQCNLHKILRFSSIELCTNRACMKPLVSLL